jgi:hypothetical protein
MGHETSHYTLPGNFKSGVLSGSPPSLSRLSWVRFNFGANYRMNPVLQKNVGAGLSSAWIQFPWPTLLPQHWHWTSDDFQISF